MLSPKIQSRLSRKRRIRAKIRGTAARPRLTVYRSLTRFFAQVIDDEAKKTIVSVSTAEIKAAPTIEGAKKAGALLAEKAKSVGITNVVFDRNAYFFHGRVKAFADAAREGGLQF